MVDKEKFPQVYNWDYNQRYIALQRRVQRRWRIKQALRKGIAVLTLLLVAAMILLVILDVGGWLCRNC